MSRYCGATSLTKKQNKFLDLIPLFRYHSNMVNLHISQSFARKHDDTRGTIAAKTDMSAVNAPRLFQVNDERLEFHAYVGLSG